MDLITITGNSKALEKREPLLEGDEYIQLGKEKERPLMFEKPTIFLTSRVHCGEVTGSFMLQGMLDLLTNANNP